ncbi:peptidase inhibitor family I36 protein [Streptomyces sp. NBC_01497]|uniref:peptidase inhibitor family I36 protein n=1 Tax=Streptomyces sp. NBC_01497 TaxID=2903885 RepID=UPI002E32C0DC|nr:peptidase inhibitor family I36 protein [Streptomyces sp. NBC_01497]
MRRVTTAAVALLAAVVPLAVAAPAGAATAPLRGGDCAAGELCLWPEEDFGGARSTYELTGVGIEDCVALPAGGSALSLANRLGRPVTAYQSATCADTGEFETYPGHGTWAPRAPYRIRAFKIWEH